MQKKLNYEKDHCVSVRTVDSIQGCTTTQSYIIYPEVRKGNNQNLPMHIVAYVIYRGCDRQ